MKKKLTILLAALALVVGGTFLSATPMALTSPPKAEASYLNSCYRAMDGSRWCWRTGCTAFEYWALGCRDGWVRSTVWYA